MLSKRSHRNRTGAAGFIKARRSKENHFVVTVDDEGNIRVHNIKASRRSIVPLK